MTEERELWPKQLRQIIEDQEDHHAQKKERHSARRDAKRPLPIRILITQNNDPDAYQHKRKKRPDVRQINHLIDAHHGRKSTHDDTRENCCYVRCLESWVDLCKNGRQQSIASN